MTRPGAGKSAKPSVKAAFYILAALLTLLGLEAAARIGFAAKDWVRAKLPIQPAQIMNLHVYQMLDPKDPGLWRLKPGYSLTLSQLMEDNRKAGRVLAVKVVEEKARQYHTAPEQVLFQVNRGGYKGPELDPRHGKVRVLTLGDSCTFGTYYDKSCYARVLERELSHRGRPVEVVNGGVEGYAPREVLKRIEEFKALKPELTTIYLGWNALYAEDMSATFQGLHSDWLSSLEKHVALIHAARRIYEKTGTLIAGRQRTAMALYEKKKNPDQAAPELARLEGYKPSFLGQVEEIITQMQSAGSRVVLFTLPGLYRLDEVPTAQALKIGHLPEFTDNPYVLAKMVRNYNQELRLLGQRRGVRVIDLEQWGLDTLKPRDKYYMDSLHLMEPGQEMIGEYLAGRLAPLLQGGGKK